MTYFESVAHDFGNGTVLFVGRVSRDPDPAGLFVYAFEMKTLGETVAKGETMSTSSLLRVAAALPASIGVPTP